MPVAADRDDIIAWVVLRMVKTSKQLIPRRLWTLLDQKSLSGLPDLIIDSLNVERTNVSKQLIQTYKLCSSRSARQYDYMHNQPIVRHLRIHR